MTVIQNLTNAPDQILQLILQDSTVATIELFYSPSTERWYANVTYGGTTINGIGLCTFPNILRQWQNIFPFGLAVASANGTDPVFLNDFSTGRVTLTFLNAKDVAALNASVFNQPVAAS